MKWFRTDDEPHNRAARSLRAQADSGALIVYAPRLLYLEIMNVAGRRWHWSRGKLVELALSLADLNFELREPTLSDIAYWVDRGLTAYDASYVALAEAESVKLITDDKRILNLAPTATSALALVDP